MEVGDIVTKHFGHGVRSRRTGLVLAMWTDVQPGINIEEIWCEVLWADGIVEQRVTQLEKVNGSR